MRVLIVDDDVTARAVVRTLVESRGHEVAAETDGALPAIELLDRGDIDLAVVDYALVHGSGRDVIEAARERSIRTILFSAYGDAIESGHLPGTAVVAKPDFLALETALEAVAASHGSETLDLDSDRRRNRAVPWEPPVAASKIDSTHDFYRVLAEAIEGDTLMAIDADDEGAHTRLLTAVRAVIRTSDRVMVRNGRITVLLVGGGEPAAQSVAARITRASGLSTGWSFHTVTVHEGEYPSDAFARLWSDTLSHS